MCVSLAARLHSSTQFDFEKLKGKRRFSTHGLESVQVTLLLPLCKQVHFRDWSGLALLDYIAVITVITINCSDDLTSDAFETVGTKNKTAHEEEYQSNISSLEKYREKNNKLKNNKNGQTPFGIVYFKQYLFPCDERKIYSYKFHRYFFFLRRP